MKTIETRAAMPDEFRCSAEAQAPAAPISADTEIHTLHHDLQVHQIELELQNAELRKARAEAEANLERYTALYDFAPIGYFTLDRSGVVIQANLAGADLLGRNRSEVIGRRLGIFVAGKFQTAFADFLQSAFDSSARQVLEIPLSAPDGDRWLIAHLGAVADTVGETCHVAALDVSDLKQAEAIRAQQARKLSRQADQLREADRRKDEFLAMLGHELRNPIAPILLAATILERQGVQDAGLFQWAVGVIKRQGQHLVRLVDDLLDVARVTQGKIALSKTWVDLREVLSEFLDTRKPLLDPQRHVLNLALPPEPVRIEADAVRLTQVMGNLVDNALKYTPDGGPVAMSLTREGDQAVIRIRDTGIGIDSSMLPRVFDLFTQIEPSLDRAQGGLGVGLALVKCVIELHGGSVEASSAGSGHGSEFVLRLPLPTGLGQPEHPLVRVPRHAPAKVRRVLVVDDQADIVTATALLLETMGHDVQMAHSGREALECARKRPLDVVLLDIGMPELSGYEVARRLRKAPGLGHLRLIAMTGYGLDADREETERAGFDWHLIKPVDPCELAAILAGLDGTEKEQPAGDCEGRKSGAGAE